MPFCRFCGAPKEDEAAICAKCNNQPIQYYQPMPPMPPPPGDDSGKIVGIIAIVILVIVIVTVVLAAVLYVMVIGFGSGGGTYTPVGSWQSMSALSNDSGKITFAIFSPEMATMDLRIFVEANGTDAGYLEWTSYSGPVTWVDGPSGASATYYDYNPNGGMINNGDYITFYGLEPDTTYSFSLYHIPTESLVSIVGVNSFTTDQ